MSHTNPWMAMRSLTRDGEVAKRKLAPGTIRRIVGVRRGRTSARSASSCVLVVLDAVHRSSRSRCCSRSSSTSWTARHRSRQVVVGVALAVAGLAVVDAGLTLIQRLLLVADRRGPDLRPAHQGVRPRAADAGRLLHPHPDRCAREPAQQRRDRRPAGVHLDAVRRWSPTSSASCWWSPRCWSCPGRSPSARCCSLPLFLLPARWVGPPAAGHHPARRCSSTPSMSTTMTERFNVVGRAAGQALRPARRRGRGVLGQGRPGPRHRRHAGDVRPGLLHRPRPSWPRSPPRWSTASAACSSSTATSRSAPWWRWPPC